MAHISNLSLAAELKTYRDGVQVMSSAIMFTDRTRAEAERAGLTHDEYLGAICEVCMSFPPSREIRYHVVSS